MLYLFNEDSKFYENTKFSELFSPERLCKI